MQTSPTGDPVEPTGQWTHTTHYGIPLRDWFAGMAMRAFTDRLMPQSPYHLSDLEIQEIANMYYRIADAMMRSREEDK